MSDKAHQVQLNDKDAWVKYKEWFQEDEPSLEVKTKKKSSHGLDSTFFLYFLKNPPWTFSLELTLN